MKKVIFYSSIVLLTYLPLSGLSQSSSDTMKPSPSRISTNKEKNIALAWDFVQANVTGNTEKVKTLLASEFMSYGPGEEDIVTTTQYLTIWKERYASQKERQFTPISGLAIEVMSGDLKGEWVMLWFTYSAVTGTKNKLIKVPTHLTMRLNNNKIIELHEYFDTGAVIKKLEQAN